MFPSSWKLFMPSQSEEMLYWAVTEYIMDHHTHNLYIPSCHIQRASSSLEPYWTSSSLSLIRASWEQTYHLHKPFLFFILPPNYSPVAYQRSGVMVLVGGLFTMVHGKGKAWWFVTNKKPARLQFLWQSHKNEIHHHIAICDRLRPKNTAKKCSFRHTAHFKPFEEHNKKNVLYSTQHLSNLLKNTTKKWSFLHTAHFQHFEEHNK